MEPSSEVANQTKAQNPTIGKIYLLLGISDLKGSHSEMSTNQKVGKKMKLVRWEFMGLHMPMMEDENGELFCTSKAIYDALGISKDDLDHIVSRHSEEFGSLRLTDCQSKEFFQKNKAEFGIQRVRSNMRLWSEDDMLTFAFHSKSTLSLEFRTKLRKFIKQNAKRGYVSQDAFEQLKGQLSELQQLVLQYLPAANEAASHAGRSLRAHRETKPLRLVTS